MFGLEHAVKRLPVLCSRHFQEGVRCRYVLRMRLENVAHLVANPMAFQALHPVQPRPHLARRGKACHKGPFLASTPPRGLGSEGGGGGVRTRR